MFSTCSSKALSALSVIGAVLKYMLNKTYITHIEVFQPEYFKLVEWGAQAVGINRSHRIMYALAQKVGRVAIKNKVVGLIPKPYIFVCCWRIIFVLHNVQIRPCYHLEHEFSTNKHKTKSHILLPIYVKIGSYNSLVLWYNHDKLHIA